mmetsp:Transcript_22719/g.21901  ORF Transcript_22719/g.21901 Transcript_22719/m.21901 type:complete len:152 (+) Transcript_22719:356-811(+)
MLDGSLDLTQLEIRNLLLLLLFLELLPKFLSPPFQLCDLLLQLPLLALVLLFLLQKVLLHLFFLLLELLKVYRVGVWVLFFPILLSIFLFDLFQLSFISLVLILDLFNHLYLLLPGFFIFLTSLLQFLDLIFPHSEFLDQVLDLSVIFHSR